jgi:hypothetical protein
MVLLAAWAPGSLRRVHTLGLRYRRHGFRPAGAVNYTNLERLRNRTTQFVIFMVTNKMDVLHFKNLYIITYVPTYKQRYMHAQLVLDNSFTLMCQFLISNIVIVELNSGHGMCLCEYIPKQDFASLNCTILDSR